jgi:hypothetical protein
MTAASPGEARPMPSLRAELNAAPRERVTQLALPRVTSHGLLPARARKATWLIMANGGSGPRAVPLYGRQRRTAWPRNPP